MKFYCRKCKETTGDGSCCSAFKNVTFDNKNENINTRFLYSDFYDDITIKWNKINKDQISLVHKLEKMGAVSIKRVPDKSKVDRDKKVSVSKLKHWFWTALWWEYRAVLY